MHYLGIDIGKKAHVAGLVGDDGQPVGKVLKFEVNREGWERLQLYIREAQLDKDNVKVGLEATGHYWLTLYEQLKALGFSITVFNPIQVAGFRNKDIRGQKTDAIDAILIAQVLRFGEGRETHIPDERTLVLRRLSRFRYDLVDQVTSVKKKILAILDQTFPEYAECFEDAFGKGSLSLLSLYPLPEEVAKLDLEKLTALLKETSKNHFGEEKARLVKAKAQETIGTKLGLDAFDVQIKILISQLQYLEEQIGKVEGEIRKLVTGHVLLSIPGISYITAGAILSEVGNIERFSTGAGEKEAVKLLTALAGLEPRLQESGQHRGQVKMSKRGSRYLRRAIMQASFVASRHDPMFGAVYEKQRKRGKHHYVALSHVGRKMIGVVYAVLRDQKPYQVMPGA